jgi:hypothetical protein
LKSEVLQEMKFSREKFGRNSRENHNQTELSDVLLHSGGERVDAHFYVLLGSAEETPDAELVHLRFLVEGSSAGEWVYKMPGWSNARVMQWMDEGDPKFMKENVSIPQRPNTV